MADHDGIRRRSFLLASAASLAGCALRNVGPKSASPSRPSADGPAVYRDGSQPVPVRVADLLRRMTLAEKLAQLQCVADRQADLQDGAGNFSPDRARRAFADGIGHVASPGMYVGRPPGGPQRGPREMALYTNAAQRWAVEQTRLGIPILFHEEALHGHRGQGSTSFPQAIALASSWDPALVEAVFCVAGREARARGARMVLTPVVDVVRDPRWGRVEETYGEDPHLVTQIGLAAVRGFQGTTLPLPDGKVLATLKHFVADGQSENGTNTGPAPIPERTLREIFFPPFETILRSLPVRSVMVTYNEIDGIPCAANHWLLTEVLRGEWGFEGMTIADYSAIEQLHSLHEVAATLGDAAVLALNAGVDVEMPDPVAFPLLAGLLAAGRVQLGRIDQAVSRVLRAKVEAGLFEQPYVDADRVEAIVGNADARQMALRAAERSLVLLKNNGLLPLRPADLKKLAVVGHHAKDTPLGGYSGTPPYVVSVLEGVTARAGDRFEVVYAEGVRLTRNRDWFQDAVEPVPDDVNDALIAEAVRTAGAADVILLVAGDNEETAREAWSPMHLGDRQTLDLWGRQNELATKLLGLGKPVAVVMLNGRPLTINLLAERADAILEGWYLGQETGTAVAKVLLGEVNPGGKLPVSIPRSVGQLPVYYNAKPTARRGYLDGSTQPLFPFGHGLSYTTFELSAPVLSAGQIRAGDTAIVNVSVRNTGEFAGDEVVQMYLHHRYPSVTQPVLALKAFRRVTLMPGERQTVQFELRPEAFAIRDERMQLVIEPGEYELHVGPGLDALKTATLTITGV